MTEFNFDIPDIYSYLFKLKDGTLAVVLDNNYAKSGKAVFAVIERDKHAVITCLSYTENISIQSFAAYKKCNSQLTALNACLKGGEPNFNIPGEFGSFAGGWDWVNPGRPNVEMTLDEVCDALNKNVKIIPSRKR